MKTLPKLNFPPIRPRARRCGEGIEVWDALRKQWLKLTPEEWVRQHLIHWLQKQGVTPQQIIQEYPVSLNGQPQRADVVVVDCQGQPLLVAECKSAEVRLSQETLAQAVRYNSILRARYLMLTNGLNHYLYALDPQSGQYAPLKEFPAL